MFSVQVKIDHKMRALCLHPYPGHPKGCPNFGKRDTCPPKIPLFEKVYDLEKPVYAIVNEFDMKGHVARMTVKHPQWSSKQLSCPLYWQPSARKKLKEKIKETQIPKGYEIVNLPEGMGVNVTETLASAGIMLEWPPVNIVRQVVLVASPLEKKVKHMSKKIVAIGGVPGTGKTLLVRELMKQYGEWFPETVANLVQTESNSKRKLRILGRYEEGNTFAGTDRLSMAVQPMALEWIKAYDENVLFEGDRLFNGSFLNSLASLPNTELFIIYLTAPEPILQERYRQRGSNQSDQFIKGRETKYARLKQEMSLRKFSREFPHKSPEDTQKIISVISSFFKDGSLPPAESKPSGIRKFFKV